MIPVSPDVVGKIHEPEKDLTPKPRRRLMAYDRLKVFGLVAVWLLFQTMLKHSSIPIISWWEAFKETLQGKAIFWVILALEAVRQIHYRISEKSGVYNQFWLTKVWGGWDRFWKKRSPWLRFRLGRIVKRAVWFCVVISVFSSIWGVSFLQGVAEAPHRFFYAPFGAQQPWFVQIVLMMSFGVLQFVGIFWFMSRGGVEVFMPEDIKTRFSDVWGQDRVLEKVKENIVFLNDPEEIEKRGGHVPGGILLWGPPGTGKTLIAEAVAGETSKPFVFVDPGSFKAMFVGVGIMKVRALYKKLRKLALRYGGVIVFFDEADTLGNRGVTQGGFNEQTHDAHSCNGMHYASEHVRSLLAQIEAELHPTAATPEPLGGIRGIIAGMGGGGGFDGSLQAILAEMSGLSKPAKGVWRWVRAQLTMPPKAPPKYRILTIMATNMPESLDAALLRPGRIDRMYHVGYPNLAGRIRTFEGYLNKIRHDLTPEQIQRLAVISPQVSGAQVKDIVNEAVIGAIRRNRDVVTWSDIIDARVFKVHGMPDGPAATTLEQWEVALHEASHAVAMFRYRKREVIDIATIEKRGPIGGFVAPVPLEDTSKEWADEMDDVVMTFLASRAGERIFFGENSSGVYGDLNSSTSIIRRMVTHVGMSDRISQWVTSDPHRTMADDEVEARLQRLFSQVSDLLNENRGFVLAIAHALVSRKTITGEDIHAIDQGSMGVVLDGRWYHDLSNRRRLEEFHRLARDHHVRKEPFFTAELPVLPAIGLAPPPPPPPPAVGYR